MSLKIKNIYIKFRTLPNLQDHMLRVGTLVKVYLDTIDDNILGKYFKFGKSDLLFAALTHDLGKFVELDLDFTQKLFPGKYSPAEIHKLKNLQKEYVFRFSNTSSKATFNMLKSVGIPLELAGITSLVDFSNIPFVYKYKIYDLMLLIYADQRVSPFGIDTLKNRINEGLKRYLRKFDKLAQNGNTIEYKNTIQQAKIEHKYIANILAKIEKALLKINPAFREVYQNLEWLNKQVSKYGGELLDLELN